MKIFAHRGLMLNYPENTILSFTHALEQGFGLEIDIHRTKDGKLVVIHDSNLKRLASIDKEITNINFDSLQKIGINYIKATGVNNTGKIPSLRETLELFRAKSLPVVELAIQVKDCSEKDIEILIVKELDQFEKDFPDFNIYKRVFVFDILISSAKKFQKLQPKLKLSLSIGENILFPDKRYPTIYNYQEAIKENCWEIVWADEWVHGLYNKEFIDKCHNDGKLVYAISPELHKDTIPKHPLSKEGFEEVWERLIRLNVDGICTDYPNKLKQLYKHIKDDNTF